MAKKKTKKKTLARRFELKASGQGKIVELSFSEMIALVDRCIKKNFWAQAAYIIEQVVSSLPRDRSILLRQLNVYLSLKLMWKAYPLAKTLLELFPADKKVLEKAIRAFLSSGYTDEALALAERSVKLYPGSDFLHNTLGLCYIDKGNKEIALQEFNAALKLGSMVIPYWNRSRIAGQLEQAEIDQMLQRAQSPEISARKRAVIYFSLAWSYEKVSIDKHFYYLKLANDLMAQEIPWSEEEALDRFRQRESFYATVTFEQTSRGKIRPHKPVFIVGMPRSGTSLLEQILSAHSQVTALGEVFAFRSAMDSVSEKIGKQGDVWNWGGPYQYENVLPTLEEAYYRQLEHFNMQAPVFTDKSLDHYETLGAQLMACPNAVAIHCLRDPMDVCWSNYQLYFESGMGFMFGLDSLAKHYNYHLKMMDLWKQLFPDRILTINYADLVASQEDETRRLLDFCGLEWEQECMEFYRQDRAARTASNLQVRQPINTKGIGRWKPYASYMKEAADILGVER